VEVTEKFKYLGVTLENTGGWKNQKESTKAKGSQALSATDKYCNV
jgi:hypothetical protein